MRIETNLRYKSVKIFVKIKKGKYVFIITTMRAPGRGGGATESQEGDAKLARGCKILAVDSSYDCI